MEMLVTEPRTLNPEKTCSATEQLALPHVCWPNKTRLAPARENGCKDCPGIQQPTERGAKWSQTAAAFLRNRGFDGSFTCAERTVFDLELRFILVWDVLPGG